MSNNSYLTKESGSPQLALIEKKLFDNYNKLKKFHSSFVVKVCYNNVLEIKHSIPNNILNVDAKKMTNFN